MAVKQDTRQKLLFANDDFPTIEDGKACTRCNEFKSASEFYTVKRKNGEGRRLAAICKQCDNARRQSNIERARGPDYVSKPERDKIAREKRDAEKQCKKENKRDRKTSDRKTPWQVAAEHQRQSLIYRTDCSLSSGWERKAEVVVSGNRKRVFSASKKRERQGATSWNKAATIQFKALKLRVKQYAMTGWDRKCASAATGQQKRLRQLRNV